MIKPVKLNTKPNLPNKCNGLLKYRFKNKTVIKSKNP